MNAARRNQKMNSAVSLVFSKATLAIVFYLLVAASLSVFVNAQIDSLGMLQYTRPMDLH
jgi:hypothetical protein